MINGIPIIVGVTGHRDLRKEDEPRLEESIRAVFSDLQKKFSSSPIILLTPLAEGSDQIVARIALEQGIPFWVLLPMPQVDYLRDFASFDSKKNFRKLISLAERVLEIPSQKLRKSERNIFSRAIRQERYRELGDLIIANSHVMIALWDGVNSSELGGTSQTVRSNLSLRGIKPKEGIDLSTSSRETILYHVVTPHRKMLIPNGEPYKVLAYPIGKGEDESEIEHPTNPSQIDWINKDINRFLECDSRNSDNLTQNLVPETSVNALSASSSILQSLFGVLDRLANHYQSRTRQSFIAIFSVISFAFLSLQVYLELWHVPTLLLVYPVLFLIAFIFYLSVNQSGYQDKYLGYRALAEGVRVHFYWDYLNTRRQIIDELYRRQDSAILSFYRSLVHVKLSSLGSRKRSRMSIDETAKHLLLVGDCWLKSQKAYYERAEVVNGKRQIRFDNIVNSLLAFGLLLAVLLATMEIVLSYYHNLGWKPPDTWNHLLFFAIVMSLALAATLSGYAYKMGFSEHRKKYSRMALLLGRAYLALQHELGCKNIDAATDIIIETGKKCFQENSEWFLLHRTRPIEVPKGG